MTENTALLVYFKNSNNAWESLPSIINYRLQNGSQYATEFWFSFNQNELKFEYRDTHPTNPTLPEFDLNVKVIIISETYGEILSKRKIDINNHDLLFQTLQEDEAVIKQVYLEIK